MDGRLTGGVLRHFAALPDPRAKNVIHSLNDMLVIALCAVLSGAQGWVDVEAFGHAKLPWLKTFLDLPGGIPSHDTFGRLFARLDPEALEACFQAWTSTLQSTGRTLVAFDGKALRQSFEHAWDKSGMAHLVSAFASEHQWSLGQVACSGKGGEQEAMARLLELLDLPLKSVVTIDAAGCHADLAARILQKEADYVLAVKENQPTLLARLKSVLDEGVLTAFAEVAGELDASVEGDHGRVETRRVWVSDHLDLLGREVLDLWPGLGSIAVVESVREFKDPGVPAVASRRYYISSLPGTDAAAMARYIRGHWGIENRLHWQLDVSFGEDRRRLRTGHGAENFSRLCRIALNLLKSDASTKTGIEAKRRKAGWNEAYLLKLLSC